MAAEKKLQLLIKASGPGAALGMAGDARALAADWHLEEHDFAAPKIDFQNVDSPTLE